MEERDSSVQCCCMPWRILWKREAALSNVVLRLGEFYGRGSSEQCCCTPWRIPHIDGVHGHHWQTLRRCWPPRCSPRIRDSVGSIDGVLSGKHYNRAVWAHKTVMEALFRLQWSKFEAWLKSEGNQVIIDTGTLQALLSSL